MTSQVVTWGDSRNNTIDVTPEQEKQFTAAGKWPRNQFGEEFCQVSLGLHRGYPTFSDAEVAEMCGQ